jgi:deoxyribose-phosphate aldolase
MADPQNSLGDTPVSAAPLNLPRWAGALPTRAQVAAMIDHSLLRPELTDAEVAAGLRTALECQVASVCVRPSDIAAARAVLDGSRVAVGTVVGFPHGSSTTGAKLFETREAVAAGATEVDVVVHIGRLRSGDLGYVRDEMAAVVQGAGGAIVKVIFENCYLAEAEKIAGYRAAEAAGAHYVKTSTGFASGGATAEDIALMRRTVSPRTGVKAAGGVRSLDALLELHQLGATRFGATATRAILDDLDARRRG